MKIVLLTDTYAPQINGVVSFIDNIMVELAKENQVVLLAPGNRKKIEIEEKSKNLRIYSMPASPFPFYEGYKMTNVLIGEVERILKEEKPDIVHAHAPVLLGVQGILIAKQKKIPIVATYHTHFPDYLPYLLNGKLPRIFNSLGKKTIKELIKFVFSLADVTTAPTNEFVKELTSYGVKNAVRLPNGIDLDMLKSDAFTCAKFRKKYGIRDGERIVLFVGRIGFEKKLETLLGAMKKVKTKCRFVIGGSGPNIGNYKQMAKTLGLNEIIFTGFLKDEMLNAAYASADIFVSPSDTETFGLTFIEAMSFGVPAIGVDKLGPKEIIENGKNGYLVRPGDNIAMANRIETLLEDESLRGAMASAARKTAENYSIQESARQTILIYNALIEKQKNAKK